MTEKITFHTPQGKIEKKIDQLTQEEKDILKDDWRVRQAKFKQELAVISDTNGKVTKILEFLRLLWNARNKI